MIRWFRKHPAFLWTISGALAFVAWFLPGKFSLWQQRRIITSAEAFLQQGDLRSAMISCHELIRLNPKYSDAYRLLIVISEQLNSPKAIAWSSKLVELSNNDPKTLTQLAAIAVRFEETEVAQEALNRLPAASKETASALSLQGTLDVLGHRLSAAETLFARAAQLEPSNLSHHLNLLKIRLQFHDPAKVDRARDELVELTRNPETKSEALRALLQDARTNAHPERALSCAQELAAAPDAPLSDKLLLLEELRASAIDRFPTGLANLERVIQSTANSGLVFQLMSWLNRHALYRETLAWKDQLPTNLKDHFPIQLSESEARVGLKDWITLRTEIATADWGGMNYLRLALCARVDRELGSGQFKERWESALVATAGEWNALMELANLAERWCWSDQAVQTFWIIARQSQGQRSALKHLYRIYSDKRDTRELYKIAKRILEVEPGDLIAVNNVASLGLLLDQDTSQKTKLAEDLYSKASSNPAFKTTYAFALLKTQRTDEAMQIIQGLPQEATNDPSIGLYYGLVLAADGKREAAKPYLTAALQRGRLFPEEESLARKALAP
jgi:Flp pilus assembly protein TadD